MPPPALPTLALLAATLLTAPAATIRPDVPLQAYRDRAAALPEARSVGSLTINEKPGQSTGFYIGDGLFATAYHSVTENDGTLSEVNDIRFGPTISDPAAVFPIDQIFLHPDGLGAGRPNDFALLYSQALRASDRPALTMADTRIPEDVVFDTIGYGKMGAMSQDPDTFLDPEFLTAGQNETKDSSLGSGFFSCDFSVPGSTQIHTLEIGASPGFSGSPAIYNAKVYGLATYTIRFPEVLFQTGYDHAANNHPFAEATRAHILAEFPTRRHWVTYTDNPHQAQIQTTGYDGWQLHLDAQPPVPIAAAPTFHRAQHATATYRLADPSTGDQTAPTPLFPALTEIQLHPDTNTTVLHGNAPPLAPGAWWQITRTTDLKTHTPTGQAFTGQATLQNPAETPPTQQFFRLHLRLPTTE